MDWDLELCGLQGTINFYVTETHFQETGRHFLSACHPCDFQVVFASDYKTHIGKQQKQILLVRECSVVSWLEHGLSPNRCGLQGTIKANTAWASQLRRSSELPVGAPLSQNTGSPPKQSAACSRSHDQNRSELCRLIKGSDKVLLSWLEEQ